MMLSAILAAALKSAKEKLAGKKAEVPVASATGATDQTTSKTAVNEGDANVSGVSQWQALQRKMHMGGGEPTIPEPDVATLLKAVFKEHMLTATPEFAKYFANDGSVQGARQLEASLTSTALQPPGSLPAAQLASPSCTSSSDPHTHAEKHHTATRPCGPCSSMWSHLRYAWERYQSSPLRTRIYLTLSHPEYSRLAMIVGILLLAVILLNTATFCIESVPHYEGTPLYRRLIMVDYACLGVFTVEFLGRLATCPSLRHFAADPLNWLDAASILPFYVELMVVGPSSQVASQTRIMRVLRLLRLLRMLRATARFRNLQVVVDSLVDSSDVIAMLALLLLVLLVVSSTIIYYIESALVPDTWFDSIPATMYYMHTTLTTTGYGDLYAQSSWGRFAAGIFMLACMVTLSLPISVVGGNFSNLWSRFTAIRDGLARSGAAWGTRRRVRALAGRHAAAMDDLIGTINDLKCELEEGTVGGEGVGELGGLAALAARISGLRAQLQDAVDHEEGSARFTELRERVVELKARLTWAKRRQGELQALLAVSGRLVSRELAESLDSLHSAHKAMAGWAVDGAWLAERGRVLLGDLRALRAVAGEEEEWLRGQEAEAAAAAAAKAKAAAGPAGGWRSARQGSVGGAGERA